MDAKDFGACTGQKAIISRGDSVVGIVFIVVFTALLIFALISSLCFFTEGETITTVPVFNLEQWETVLLCLCNQPADWAYR